MPVRQIDYGTREYEQMLNLRQEILRKPLNLDLMAENLEGEKNDILIGAFDEDMMLGCCLLTRVDNSTIQLRQMAVQDNLQGKGVGGTIMHFAENVARDKGYKKMMMHARTTAEGFYEKLGYHIVGDEFMEVSLPHFIMEKNLTVRDLW
ncbi:MAG: GNAT family N-acetyltransferase [Ginsengibacter sp.]